MRMNRNTRVGKDFFFGIVTFLLVGCGGIAQNTTVLPLTANPTEKPIHSTATINPGKSTSTLAPDYTASETMHPTTTPVVKGTERAKIQQLQNDNETKVAQFPIACDGRPSGNISPYGGWLATSCGSKTDQTLIVQNKEGTKWILEFKDFLSPDSPAEVPGTLLTKFWSPDEEYLYFVPTIGYSGGGNDCVPRYGRGEYGLFRLNLKTGSWTTLIPPRDSFPGYGIEFSPTGRRYAATINGVMITDLNTGEITKIDTLGTIQGLSWSPDGIHLAYSVASCSIESLQSSSVYVWDALTNQTQLLITTNEMLLRPELWSDDLTLRVKGEKYALPYYQYTIYVYDISQDDLVFTGTITPSP